MFDALKSKIRFVKSKMLLSVHKYVYNNLIIGFIACQYGIFFENLNGVKKTFLELLFKNLKTIIIVMNLLRRPNLHIFFGSLLIFIPQAKTSRITAAGR